MKGTLNSVPILLAGILLACASGQALDTKSALAVGAPALAAEADAMRPLGSQLRLEVPEPSWPPGIRRLQPQAVRVAPEGVFVQRRKRFVDEEGVFIAFAGVDIDTEPGRDPFFSPIASRVYWYKIKG